MESRNNKYTFVWERLKEQTRLLERPLLHWLQDKRTKFFPEWRVRKRQAAALPRMREVHVCLAS